MDQVVIKMIRSWLSERRARAYQKQHTKRMLERRKHLPKETLKIEDILTTLNNNSWGIHHLYKKAKNKKQFANAFLYFFYSLELNLKHLIISEMNLKNSMEMLKKRDMKNFFLIYSENEMIKILELNPTGEVIKKFLEIFPRFVAKKDLWEINKERNYIIHNMLKESMKEFEIEKSFENFFLKTSNEMKNILIEFDTIMVERPNTILRKIEDLSNKNKKQP